jgi:hypothetical protein
MTPTEGGAAVTCFFLAVDFDKTSRREDTFVLGVRLTQTTKAEVRASASIAATAAIRAGRRR